jgi:hypothetical protein
VHPCFLAQESFKKVLVPFFHFFCQIVGMALKAVLINVFGGEISAGEFGKMACVSRSRESSDKTDWR